MPSRPVASRCAVLGDPVDHSLSPTLHRSGYDAVGLTGWTYEAVRASGADLPRLLAELAPPWRGLSLTMPLKRDVLALVGRTGGDGAVTERARRAGAGNTVLVTDDGLRVDNTDLPGATAALRERHDGPVSAVTILGAGATAASTGLALCDLGARRVVLLARSPERAAETLETLRRHPDAPDVEVRDLDDLAELSAPSDEEVLVSTVPASAQTPALVAAAVLRAVVFEVLYDPWPTPLARAALAEGRTLVGGLDLLVHQAALQFTAFTGVPAPLAAMRAAGERELARRQVGTA